MDSQITKIPSICGDSYPGVGFQVDNGDSVRVAMAWPSASAGGWRCLTMEVPKKLSLETELNGVSVDYLLQRADVLFGDGDLGGFKRYEHALGDKMPSAVVRAFARYAPIDLTHAGTTETCRDEIVGFLGGEIPELGSGETEKVSGKTRAVLVPVGQDPVAIEIDGAKDIMDWVGGGFDEASSNLPRGALPFDLSMYENGNSKFTLPPNRGFFTDGKATGLVNGNVVVVGFNPETGEDVSLTDGELMDTMRYFQRESPRGSGTIACLAILADKDAELNQPNVEESLDEMMEQKAEVAGDIEPDVELGVSNGER